MNWFQKLCVSDQVTIKEAMSQLNTTAQGILLVVGEGNRLQDVVTDGDLRRGLLNGQTLETPIQGLLAEARQRQPDRPVRALADTPESELLELMRLHKVAQLPLVDEDGTLVDLVSQASLLEESLLPIKAVIMAGGFGKRLKPLTNNTPKPMLLLDGKPLLERTICQLRKAGIRDIDITTHFLAEKIVDHFGDGASLDVDLKYIHEHQPMGTAGGLKLIDESAGTLLVMNGDILTGIDFRALLEFHQTEKADLTIGVRQYDIQIPYGVVDAEGSIVKGLVEKPTHVHFINAGIYLLEKKVREHIPAGCRFDMTQLIESLLQTGHHVACFPIIEYWIDIGQHDDFNKAQSELKGLKWAA